MRHTHLAVLCGRLFAQWSRRLGFLTVLLGILPTAVMGGGSNSVAAALKWRSLGPDRGGRVTAVCGVPGERWRFYAGTAGGGVLRTDDAGQTWRALSTPVFGSGSVGAIAVSPSDRDVVYVGMGESTYRTYSSSLGDGVYKSVDGGNTWESIGLRDPLRIGSIAVDPRSARVAYVAAMGNPWAPSTARGLYKTNDGGLHWERVLFVNDTTSMVDVSIDPTHPETLYVSTWDNVRSPWYLRDGGPGSGIFKSRDAGKTWRRLSNGLPKAMGKIGIAVSPADSSAIYALVESTPKLGGLFVSNDYGKHWHRVNGANYLWDRSWYYMELTPDPKRRNRLWVMDTDLWRSDDGGAHFVKVDPPHGDNHALWINPHDTATMIEGNDGGATVTFDGGETWSSQFNQPTGQFYRVAVDTRQPYDILGAQQDWGTVSIRSRNDLGGPSSALTFGVGGGESGYVIADPFRPNLLYAGGELGLLTRYDRRTRLATPIMPYPRFPEGVSPRELRYRFDVNAPLVASVHTSGTIYHAAQVVLRSRDRGETWEPISPDLTLNEASKEGPAEGPFQNERIDAYNVISTLDESPLDANILWAGTDDGKLWVTRNGGGSWQNVTPPSVEDGLFYSVSASPSAAGGAAVALTRNRLGDLQPYLFVTNDLGRTWKTVSSGLPQTTFARVVRQDPLQPRLLYAGTGQGVFVTADSGETWHRLGADLPTTPVTDLVVKGNDLVISTEGRGFWSLRGLDTLRQSTSARDDESTRLFTPPTAYITEGVPQEVPEASAFPDSDGVGVEIDAYVGARDAVELPKVRLQILDANGRVVRTLRFERGTAATRPLAQPPGALPSAASPRVAGELIHTWWDLRRDRVAARIQGAFDGSMPGAHVTPARYYARLRTVSGDLRAPVDVQALPSLPQPTAAQLAEKERLIEQIAGTFTDIVNTVNSEATRRAVLAAHGQSREAQQLAAWEHKIFDRRLTDFQGRVNYGGGLLFDLLTLSTYVDDSALPIPAAMVKATSTYARRWQAIRSTLP